MTEIYPEGVPVFGNTSVRFVAAITSLTAPSLAEIMAAAPASLGITGYLLAENWSPNQDAAKGSGPRRLGNKQVFERFNTTTIKLDDLRYAYSPQGAAASDGKKAYETLTEAKVGFFVERLGVDRNVAWAVGQFVNIIPVVLGPQLIAGDTDENGDYTIMQPVSIRAARSDNKALAA